MMLSWSDSDNGDEYDEDEWDDDTDDDYFDEKDLYSPGGARRDQSRKSDDTRPGRRKDGSSQDGRPDNGGQCQTPIFYV